MGIFDRFKRKGSEGSELASYTGSPSVEREQRWMPPKKEKIKALPEGRKSGWSQIKVDAPEAEDRDYSSTYSVEGVGEKKGFFGRFRKTPEERAEEAERDKEEAIARRVLKAKETAARVKEREADVALAQQERSFREAGGGRWSAFKRGARGAEEVAKGGSKAAGILYKIGTLGGTSRRSNKEVRSLYLGGGEGKSREELYGASGMRSLTAPPTAERNPLRSISTPMLGRLRQGRVGKESAMGRRMSSETSLVIPQGKGKLSPLEKLAMSDVVASGPTIDIQGKVFDDLVQLGVPEDKARKVVMSLTRKGYIQSPERRV